MFINLSVRTDIANYYSEWFINRILDGYVLVRNPYYPKMISKVILNPRVVDCIIICTKNPKPLFDKKEHLRKYNLFWYVTITPYTKDIEPEVPPTFEIISNFKEVSKEYGIHRVGWRYDPIIINSKYTMEFHYWYFEKMCKELEGYTHRCVISFIKLNDRLKKKNEYNEISDSDKKLIVKQFVEIAKRYKMTIQMCAESKNYEEYGVLNDSCISKEVLEKAMDKRIMITHKKALREHCKCIPTTDIGEYNCCPNGCKYCYANRSLIEVKKRFQQHNPMSPLLIGKLEEDDQITLTNQKSNIKEFEQISFEF